MILPNDHEYYLNCSSNPPHTSGLLDQYLGVAQSSSSSLDSDESQQWESSIAAGRAPQWFTDCVLYDSDDAGAQPDAMSVSDTIELARVDSHSDISTTLLFDLPLAPVPASIVAGAHNSSSLYRWPNTTGLDNEDLVVGPGSTDNNLQWNTAEPAFTMSTSNQFDNGPGVDSQQSSPGLLNFTQIDIADRIPVSRMRHFVCPKCQRHCLSESRFSEHLRRSHPPAECVCRTCGRMFKKSKDLKRHIKTHEPLKQYFTCSCRRRYVRRDGLLRHFNEMAEKSDEAGLHKAVESDSI